PALLERAAAMYADASPAAIRCGWGPERNRNGGSAIAAVLALPAVAGKFGVRGGGYTMSNGRALALGDDAVIAEPEVATREINMNQVGRVLTAGRAGGVFALFVYNCNPLATLPDQNAVRRGLLRPDLFTIVFDQVMTDTARYADVILPATTFLEHDELRSGYGAMAVQRTRPVVAPYRQARPNYAVFAELCARLGLARPGDPIDADALADAVLAGSALPEAALRDLAAGDIAASAGGIQFVDELPRTADRRIHLVPPSLDAEAGGRLYHYREDPETAAHPLALISPAVARQVSSTFGQLDRRPAALHMHPDDAAARGLADGDRVRVFNDLGEVVCRVAIDRDMRRRVVGLAKGLWSHHTENGASANALCPDALADLGGGATFNDARVQVEAAR
ncbi:MAG: molybdopterin-dependent oxidoreductase, partial [Myxococcales bacterium]|nr:molybdopterin-dependent oxidoreductase [Myxococcales bacterium]